MLTVVKKEIFVGQGIEIKSSKYQIEPEDIFLQQHNLF